ncbi:hypothetical protein AABB24_031751 [Solanum stoloniferum]|uniref:Agenet domain-containing protein n=1 Tax=Solanum stoloniferum TaxID=62892 RepID=A0ABD2RUY3_9SOLN
MARIKVTENNSEERHKSRMEMLSDSVKSIAFKKQQITKVFQKGDEVEVASQVYGFVGSYYEAIIVSSIGAYHYRITYKNLLTDDESAPLEEMFTSTAIRLVPPHQDETTSETDSVCTIWLMYLQTMDGGLDLSVGKLEKSTMSTSLQLQITLHTLVMC